MLETVQALEATSLRHLSDLHLVGDGRHATANLCIDPPGEYRPTHPGEAILPVALEEQLEALAASGLVGQLHVSVLKRGAAGGELHLLARTHAGSAAERAAWRRSLG